MIRLILLTLTILSTSCFAAPDTAKKLRRDAESFMVNKDYVSAEKTLTKVIRLEPNVASNYFKRARVLQRRGKRESAVRDLRRAIENSEKPYDAAHISLGKLLRRLGRCEEAVTHLRKAIEINPKRNEMKIKSEMNAASRCANRYGDIRKILGNSFETLQDFKSVPENALRHVVVYIQDIANETPHAVSLLLVLARVHVALDELYEALAQTGRALKIQRENLTALMLRTQIYYRLAEHDVALTHVRCDTHLSLYMSLFFFIHSTNSIRYVNVFAWILITRTAKMCTRR
jgi:tetratricopeptide (TPR) repeat protein